MKGIKRSLEFYLGGKDLEMIEIKNALAVAGQVVRDTNLSWGAKASAYGQEIKMAITGGHFIPVLVELELDIELPENSFVVVDHHNDSAGRPASILQVLDLLGLEPTRHQLLVAADDSSYIPGMLAMEATPERNRGYSIIRKKRSGNYT